ncbi:MAG: hypothetical protein AB2558_21395 [Candidatus Thiodiazotropha sp.]
MTATTLNKNTHALNNLSFISGIDLHKNAIPPTHNLNTISEDLKPLFHNLSLTHSIPLFLKIVKPPNNAPKPNLQKPHKKEFTTPIRGNPLHNLNNNLIPIPPNLN